MKHLLLIAPLAALTLATGTAAPLKSAKVTQVVKDVRLYPSGGEGRAATVGDELRGSAALHTGRRSRAELTFPDSTLTRIGANSVFSFAGGGREVDLQQGSLLIQTPKGNGGATIRTATVTAAITGSTAMFEYSPNQWVKFINLEGTMKLGIKGRKDQVDVLPGQMIMMHPNGREVPAPVIINLARLVRTSKLAGRQSFGPLPEGSLARISEAVAGQMDARRTGDLAPSGIIAVGGRLPAETTGGSTQQGESLIRDAGGGDSHHQEPDPWQPPHQIP